jgi:hypothetical protein
MVEVETAQEILVGFAAPRMLGCNQPRHRFQQFGHAEKRPHEVTALRRFLRSLIWQCRSWPHRDRKPQCRCLPRLHPPCLRSFFRVSAKAGVRSDQRKCAAGSNGLDHEQIVPRRLATWPGHTRANGRHARRPDAMGGRRTSPMRPQPLVRRSDGSSPCRSHPLDQGKRRQTPAGLTAHGSQLDARLPRPRMI